MYPINIGLQMYANVYSQGIESNENNCTFVHNYYVPQFFYAE